MKNRFARLATASGQTVLLKAEAGAEAKWNRLFPLGVVGYRGDFPGGKLAFTREFLASMVTNWQRHGRLPLQVNYLHRGDTSPDDLPLEEKIAAGWIEDLELREDGLYGLIRWTEKARGYIARDELRYLSPEFHPDGHDRLTGKRQGPTLGGCALLNDPFITQQERVAAANNPKAAQAAGEDTMDRNKLIAILGLAATATDEDILKAIESQKVQLGNLDAEVKKLSAQVTEKIELANGATKLAQELKDLREENVKLTSRVSAMEAEKKTAEVDAYLTALVKDGKLAPAMRDAQRKLALSDFATFKESWDKAPVVIALGERGITGTTETETRETAMVKLRSAADEIAKKDGVPSSEAFIRAMAKNPELARIANG